MRWDRSDFHFRQSVNYSNPAAPSLALSLNPFPPPHSPYLIPPLHLSIYLPPLFFQFPPLSRTGSSSSCSILHHSISHPLLIPVLSSPATNWFPSSRSHFLTFVFLFSFLLLSLIFLHHTMSLLPLLSTPSFLLPLPLQNLFPNHKSVPLVSLLSSPLILSFRDPLLILQNYSSNPIISPCFPHSLTPDRLPPLFIFSFFPFHLHFSSHSSFPSPFLPFYLSPRCPPLLSLHRPLFSLPFISTT